MTADKLLLSEREAALVLGVSVRHLHSLRKRGDIPYVLLGRRVLYSPAALKAWIENRAVIRGVSCDDRRRA